MAKVVEVVFVLLVLMVSPAFAESPRIKLAFLGDNANRKPAAAPAKLQDKTLVAWVTLANLVQRGGSALTLDDADAHFDGIVFGERTSRRWMPGSDFFRRTPSKQDAWSEESADSKTLVQIALVYQGQDIRVYRNGTLYAEHRAASKPPAFGSDAVVLIGPRHLEASDNAHFAGSIADARIYDRALTAEQIKSLKVKVASDPSPWAWWTFDGSEAEKTGRFKTTRLIGGAKLVEGRLVLDGRGATLVAVQSEVPARLNALLRPPLPVGAIETARALRLHLLADPHRPTYHFVMPEGDAIPFDPNGAIFWRGRYHLFYIFQDRGVHKFGHVSSRDLFHWRQHPPALFPTSDSPERGIFSGNAFVAKNGKAVMMYHGVGAGNCIALSDDPLLERWRKNPAGNPIVANPPAEAPFASWDPHAWLEGDTYYAIFGGTPGSRKPASVFKSANLAKWTYVGPLMTKDIGVGDVSCPDFFKLGDKRVLVCISHQHGARYYIGQWKDEHFHPEYHEMMSWADNTFFAPESLLDDKDRRILWAWVLDEPGIRARRGHGWSGTMSLPRVLTLGEDKRLHYAPPKEVEALRYNAKSVAGLALKADEEKVLEDIKGNAIELDLEMDVSRKPRRAGLRVCRSAEGTEYTAIYYDAAAKKLTIDPSKSSRDGRQRIEQAPLRLKEGESLRLRVFIDKSIVEVFVGDGRQAACRRIYPNPAHVGVSIFCEGAAVSVKSVRSWDMMPSNPY